MINISI